MSPFFEFRVTYRCRTAEEAQSRLDAGCIGAPAGPLHPHRGFHTSLIPPTPARADLLRPGRPAEGLERDRSAGDSIQIIPTIGGIILGLWDLRRAPQVGLLLRPQFGCRRLDAFDFELDLTTLCLTS
jgi:hypothetical protein